MPSKTPRPDEMTAWQNRILAEARSWCGTPYMHQAALKHIGADCLGLLRGVYAALYHRAPEVPPYAPFAGAQDEELLWQAANRFLTATEEPVAAGQVLLFRMRRHHPMRHVGIATGGQAMVHAMRGGPVCEIELTAWWRRHLAAQFTFPRKVAA